MREGIESIIAAHQLRAVNRTVTRKGGEAFIITGQDVSRLYTTVGGTVYPIFILGQNDIDSTSPEYYVP